MLGVIVLNYNGASDTINCLNSVIANNSYPTKYVVVDNASSDNSVELLDNYLSASYNDNYQLITDEEHEATSIKQFSLLCSSSNCGYAQGNNLGLRLIEEDPSVNYVMVLNSDVLFTSDIIPSLIEHLESTDDAGLISPLLFCKDRTTIDYNCARLAASNCFIIKTFLLQYFDLFHYITKTRDSFKILKNNPEQMTKDLLPIQMPSGSCMLIKKSLFKEIGWFDPGTFLYYEENILYKKLLKNGKTNYLCPQLSCIHLGAQSTSKKPVPFLKRKEAESAKYYLENYGEMTCFQNFLSKIAFPLFFLRMDLSSFVKKHS